MKDGTPRKMNRSVSTSMTSVELSLRFTRIARHSRLCFVHNVQRPEDLAVVGSVMDKIIGPDMVAVLWPQPYAGSVRSTRDALSSLFHWYFQPLSPPQAFNALVIDLQPASLSKAAIRRYPYRPYCRTSSIMSATRRSSSSRPRGRRRCVDRCWPSTRTDTTFRQVQFATDMINADTATSGVRTPEQ